MGWGGPAAGEARARKAQGPVPPHQHSLALNFMYVWTMPMPLLVVRPFVFRTSVFCRVWVTYAPSSRWWNCSGAGALMVTSGTTQLSLGVAPLQAICDTSIKWIDLWFIAQLENPRLMASCNSLQVTKISAFGRMSSWKVGSIFVQNSSAIAYVRPPPRPTSLKIASPGAVHRQASSKDVRFVEKMGDHASAFHRHVDSKKTPFNRRATGTCSIALGARGPRWSFPTTACNRSIRLCRTDY